MEYIAAPTEPVLEIESLIKRSGSPIRREAAELACRCRTKPPVFTLIKTVLSLIIVFLHEKTMVAASSRWRCGCEAKTNEVN